MNIGYPCITVGLNNTNLKNCILKNATDERLMELINHNLNSLNNIIDFNIENNIKLFRLSSDLIPFASSPKTFFQWQDHFSDKLFEIGKKARENNLRLSMHPGQYTVLNSPNKGIVTRAIEDLQYHCDILDIMGMNSKNKIVLHIGGVYGDKNKSINEFIKNYHCLNESIKNRLVLENDDRSYNIEDVLYISSKTNAPVVFDNLHNYLNASNSNHTELYWIEQCAKTWKKCDGRQKIHYAQQELNKRPGSHSTTIRIEEFMQFYNNIKSKNIDIMLEVKDKNLSAIKCINCISTNHDINALKNEWKKYKYYILEKSKDTYNYIENLINSEKEYPAIEFYKTIENSFFIPYEFSNSLYAINYIWSYLCKKASEDEILHFNRIIERLNRKTVSINLVKKFLFKISLKYNNDKLINSYYFTILQ